MKPPRTVNAQSAQDGGEPSLEETASVNVRDEAGAAPMADPDLRMLRLTSFGFSER